MDDEVGRAGGHHLFAPATLDSVRFVIVVTGRTSTRRRLGRAGTPHVQGSIAPLRALMASRLGVPSAF